MPAYNAAKTLERTYADIPTAIIDRIILVDDVSDDETVEIARQLGLHVIVHRQNLGYGGNQKTCYDAAIEAVPTSWSCSTRTTSTTRHGSRPSWPRSSAVMPT